MNPLRRVFCAAAVSMWGLGCGSPRPPPDPVANQPSGPAIPGELDSLITVAESLYRAGDYEEARKTWVMGLTRIQAGRDLPTEARILTWLGLTNWRLGDYDVARTLTEQARTILEANGIRAPRTYNALGLIAWDQGRMSEAAELWRRTLQVAREVGDQEYVAKPGMNLGLWYAGIGEFEQARAAFEASLIAGRKLGDRPLELRSLVNLAMVANQMGEPRLALAWLDSAAAAGVEDDFLAEDNYRSQLALSAWALGDPGVALAGLDSAVRRAREAGLRQSEAANLSLMAEIYWDAGDLVRALDLNARAEAIHGELDLPSEQGQNLQSAARIQAALGNNTQARGLAGRALVLHQRADDLMHQLDDRLLLAELGSSGQLAEARRITLKLSSRSARTSLGLAEAHLAANAHQPRTVLRALATIDPDLVNGLSAEVSEAEALRARAYGSLGRWDSAATSGRRAVAALARIGSGFGSSPLRTSFSSFRAGVYGQLVAALLALGQTDEAFEVADAARGAWDDAVHRPDEDRSVREAGSNSDEPLRRIAALENEIRSREAEGLKVAELQERLRQAEREYEITFLNAGKTIAPRIQPEMSASQVRAALAPDEAMFSYLVTPDQLFVFATNRNQTQARVLYQPRRSRRE